MIEIESLIIPSIASVTVVLGWLYFFLKPNPPHAGFNPKAKYIINLALFSIIFFVASLITIIFTATIGGYLFIFGWLLLLGSILTFFLNRPAGL